MTKSALDLARIALSAARESIPAYSSKFSRKDFSQPGLLAEVVVSKFAEHLPLYRFEDISTRHGQYVSRSTLCD
jgi:transposase